MNFFKTFLLYFLVFYCKPIFAQKAVVKSPWVIGLETGVNLHLDCRFNCWEKVAVSSLRSNSAFVHFRLKRWIAITANTAHYLEHTYSNASLWDSEERFIPLVQRDFRTSRWALSVGPKFLLRLGKGELGLEVRYGRVYSSTRLNALVIGGQAIDIKYKALVFNSESTRLGYTYWPKPRIGINISLESTLIFDPGSTDRHHTPKTSLEENYPEVDSGVLTNLAPAASGSDFCNIILGITYRFK